MGDHVSIGEALTITGFSMVVVFIILVLISILISGLRQIGGDKTNENLKAGLTSVKKDKPAELPRKDIVDDEELVAVIAAAIAASIGVSVPEINIKNIRRIPQNMPVWAVAGRKEQTSGKL